MALLSAPLLLITAWVVLNSQKEVIPTASVAPVFAPLETSSESDGQAVKVSLTWTDSIQMVYQGPAGTVTATPTDPGTVVADGQAMLEVDGASIRAIFSDKPLYSTVTDKSPKEQVRAVNDFLASLGKPVPTDHSLWTAATAGGIKAVATESGWPAPIDGEFDPQWTAWVPQEGFTVDNMTVKVGFPAPADGEALASSRRSIVEAQITPAPNTTSTYTLQVDGSDVPVTDGNADLVSLAALTAPPQEGSTTEESGTLVDDTQAPVISVAPGAVLTGAHGHHCLVVRHDGATRAPAVETVGGTPGVTYLRADDALVGEYLTNPLTATIQVPPCRS